MSAIDDFAAGKTNWDASNDLGAHAKRVSKLMGGLSADELKGARGQAAWDVLDSIYKTTGTAPAWGTPEHKVYAPRAPGGWAHVPHVPTAETSLPWHPDDMALAAPTAPSVGASAPNPSNPTASVATAAKEAPEGTSARAMRGIKSNWRLLAGGAAAIAGVGLLFSGSDDEYNYIEGMKHAGFAGQTRKHNTDFGSGWRGALTKAKDLWSRTKKYGYGELRREIPLLDLDRAFSYIGSGGAGWGAAVGGMAAYSSITPSLTAALGGAGIGLGLKAAKGLLGKGGRNYRKNLAAFKKSRPEIERYEAAAEKINIRAAGPEKTWTPKSTLDLGAGFSHGAPNYAHDSILETQRLLPGGSNALNEAGSVGVYGSRMQKGSREELLSAYAKSSATGNSSVSDSTFFFIPEKELSKLDMSEGAHLYTRNQSIRFESTEKKILRTDMKPRDFRMPRIGHADKPHAVRSYDPKTDAVTLSRTDFIERRELEGFSATGVLRDFFHQKKVEGLRRGTRRLRGEVEVRVLKGVSTEDYNPSHIGRPTKIVKEEGGISAAFSNAEAAGLSDPNNPAAIAGVGALADEIAGMGGNLYVKGGVAREHLVSSLRPEWTRQSKDIDLLVTGDIGLDKVYGAMAKHQSFFDVQIQKDLPSFFKGTDMTANQAVIEASSGRLLHTQAAADDIVAGKVRYLDMSDAGRAHQRMSKFQGYYPGMQIEPGKISGKDDAYNVIEGLRHEGFKGPARKKTADFGSGWNALRGLTRAAETFAEMTGSPGFQDAIALATRVKRLGAGASGEAHLMEGYFRGQSFNFVRKAGRIPKSEVALTSKASSSVGPDVYAARPGRQGQMDMEYFEGSPLKDLSPSELREVGLGRINEAVSTLHEQMRHGDLNFGNIVLTADQRGAKRIGIIDYGSPLGQWTGKGKRHGEIVRKEGGGRQIRAISEEAALKRDKQVVSTLYERQVRSNRALNPEEGMAHGGGVADATRSKKTDFGSPWQGLDHALNRRYEGQIGQQKVTDYEIEDADTVKLMLSGGNTMSLRLAGIDAPEVSHGDAYASNKVFQDQPYGERATEMLEELMASQSSMTAVFDPNAGSTYGRTPALLFGDDNVNLNLQLVRQGAAASLPFGKASDRIFDARAFNRAQEEAVESETGMWSDAGWRAAHNIQKGAKRKITHNAFTDLERLFGNFRASSIVHRIRNPDTELSAMQAAGGRDDSTIQEGLRHGWAQANRQANIGDFGSGYRIDGVINTVKRSTRTRRGLMEGNRIARGWSKRMMNSENWTQHHIGN